MNREVFAFLANGEVFTAAPLLAQGNANAQLESRTRNVYPRWTVRRDLRRQPGAQFVKQLTVGDTARFPESWSDASGRCNGHEKQVKFIFGVI
ncbi:MAG TPA: hypothetical protein VKX49_07555 [Bryobacteraceae bacterium]|nr:hypothetical protein [Bryobacteraceae bacterium]